MEKLKTEQGKMKEKVNTEKASKKLIQAILKYFLPSSVIVS